MSVRVYLVPKDGDGLTLATAFRPRYVSGGIAGAWSAVDFGAEPTMLIVANVTLAEHAAISAHVDVVTLPANLDAIIAGNLATVQSALEGLNLPADWVVAGMTYRVVLRVVVRIMLLLQRVNGLAPAAGRFFANGTLDNTLGDLPVVWRQRLSAAATSFGVDVSALTLTTTIRAALRNVGQQLLRLPCAVGGESL